MSTDWELYCTDCDTETDLQWNHGETYIAQLIPELARIAQMRAVENILNAHFVNFEFPADLLPFAELHATHKVVPRDEYGQVSGRCARRVVCRSCDSRIRCMRPPDHDGECAPTLEVPDER